MGTSEYVRSFVRLLYANCHVVKNPQTKSAFQKTHLTRDETDWMWVSIGAPKGGKTRNTVAIGFVKAVLECRGEWQESKMASWDKKRPDGGVYGLTLNATARSEFSKAPPRKVKKRKFDNAQEGASTNQPVTQRQSQVTPSTMTTSRGTPEDLCGKQVRKIA